MKEVLVSLRTNSIKDGDKIEKEEIKKEVETENRHKKYVLLDESLKALKNKTINLLILSGEAGIGKSHTTIEYLKNNKINYKYIHSYVTPLYFYKLLFENRNRDIIVFDDLEGINDPKTISMIKSLCWSYNKEQKEVSYQSTSDKLKDNNLKESFKTNIRVVLIFNNIPNEFKAIVNRAITLNFDFNFQEKLQIFEDFKVKANIEQEVLDYVSAKCTNATRNLSIRSLVILSDLKRNGFNFKDFAEEILNIDENISFMSDLVQKCNSANGFKKEDAIKEFIANTGLSRRTFFNYLKKMKGGSKKNVENGKAKSWVR